LFSLPTFASEFQKDDECHPPSQLQKTKKKDDDEQHGCSSSFFLLKKNYSDDEHHCHSSFLVMHASELGKDDELVLIIFVHNYKKIKKIG
jgi:hypothetical protein